jgi:cysteine protease ATG4
LGTFSHRSLARRLPYRSNYRPADDDEEEDSDGDFFDAGEGAVVDDRVSSRAASKSGQSEDTEDDPIGPMTPGPITTPTTVTSSTPVKTKNKTTPSGKSHAVSFAHTASTSTEGKGDFDDKEWVDPTPIPATPLDTTPPLKALFQKNSDSVPLPLVMAKTKSSSSNCGRSGRSREHRKEARAPAL